MQGEWGLTEKDEEAEKKRSANFVDFVIPNTRAQLRVLAQSYQVSLQSGQRGAFICFGDVMILCRGAMLSKKMCF